MAVNVLAQLLRTLGCKSSKYINLVILLAVAVGALAFLAFIAPFFYKLIAGGVSWSERHIGSFGSFLMVWMLGVICAFPLPGSHISLLFIGYHYGSPAKPGHDDEVDGLAGCYGTELGCFLHGMGFLWLIYSTATITNFVAMRRLCGFRLNAYAKRKGGPMAEAIDAVISGGQEWTESFQVVLLLRITPMPVGMQTCLCAATSIPLQLPYVAAGLLGNVKLAFADTLLAIHIRRMGEVAYAGAGASTARCGGSGNSTAAAAAAASPSPAPGTVDKDGSPLTDGGHGHTHEVAEVEDGVVMCVDEADGVAGAEGTGRASSDMVILILGVVSILVVIALVGIKAKRQLEQMEQTHSARSSVGVEAVEAVETVEEDYEQGIYQSPVASSSPQPQQGEERVQQQQDVAVDGFTNPLSSGAGKQVERLVFDGLPNGSAV